MKEILTTSDTALKDQSKDTLNNYRRQLNFLLKGLKNCEPITGNLLIRIIERLDVTNPAEFGRLEKSDTNKLNLFGDGE